MSNLPPEQWRALFDRAGVDFGYRPLASRMGVDHTRVRRLLRGGGTTSATVQLAADALGVSPSRIRELRDEATLDRQPFTLPDDAERLNDEERDVIRAVVRALLNAKDSHDERTEAASPQAEAAGAPSPPDARKKTGDTLGEHFDQGAKRPPVRKDGGTRAG